MKASETSFRRKLEEDGQVRLCADSCPHLFPAVRDLAHLSGNAMARLAHINPRTAHDYLKAIKSPPLNKAIRILDRLGYDVYLVKKTSGTEKPE